MESFTYSLNPLPLMLTSYIIRYPYKNQEINIGTVLLTKLQTLLNFISFPLSFFCFRM